MINKIESLLNLKDPITKQNLESWDKGDCSDVGICEILLDQIIRNHKSENGSNYNTDYDYIKLRYSNIVDNDYIYRVSHIGYNSATIVSLTKH